MGAAGFGEQGDGGSVGDRGSDPAGDAGWGWVGCGGMSRLVVGVDVGGTYTDLFCSMRRRGRRGWGRFRARGGEEAVGFAAGIEGLAALGGISAIVHGTTVGTNALLERKGAKAGLITTAGFRDVLAMRRRDRRATWGLTGHFVPPIPRERRLEVAERTLADGTVHTAVDSAEVAAAARALLAEGAESLAIVFLHSYANPANEQAALAAARAVWPNEHVAASADILPEIREFERTSTAALNAVLQPTVGGYLRALDARLRGGGVWGGVPDRAEQWGGDVCRDGGAAAGSDGVVGAGGGGDCGGAYRGGGRVSGHHHGGYWGDQLRCFVGGGGAAAVGGADDD